MKRAGELQTQIEKTWMEINRHHVKGDMVAVVRLRRHVDHLESDLLVVSERVRKFGERNPTRSKKAQYEQERTVDGYLG